MSRVYDKDRVRYIDLSSGMVINYEDNKIIATLGKRDIKVLELLIMNNCKLTTRKDLINYSWFGRVVTDSVLNVSISKIRKVLLSFDPNAKDLITTVNGFGYYFNLNSSTLIIEC